MGRTRLCYSATPSTCPICQAPYYQTRIGRPRETCGSRPCVNTFISQQRFTLAKQAKADVATGVWTRPLPPAPPMYTPDAPRERVLPDGTIAIVLWAGDMVTPFGKGALLPPRPSKPDLLAEQAPGSVGIHIYPNHDPSCQSRIRHAKRQARYRQQRRQAESQTAPLGESDDAGA